MGTAHGNAMVEGKGGGESMERVGDKEKKKIKKKIYGTF